MSFVSMRLMSLAMAASSALSATVVMMSGKIVLALVKDLFFRSKLDVVAGQVGAEVGYASDLDGAARRCIELTPSLVIVDLSDAAFPAAASCEKIRAEAPGARI